ncbi:sensor histidine kinase [Thiobacter aerophilum]|uniref:histidine kinase n=1 Tax=Thiobacter aerophilum TaxID=3121275 RepID=A0ABV0EBJ4_9BURK
MLHYAKMFKSLGLALTTRSLRGRLMLGYYAVAVIMLAVSLFFVGELRTLEARVMLGQRASDLFDTVLGIRRFERNYFLHGQPADQVENARYVAAARELLTVHRDSFRAIAAEDKLVALDHLLLAYREKMEAYVAADAAQRGLLEPQVRELGKGLVELAQQMAVSERQQVQSTLGTLRVLLLGMIGALALFVIGLGRALSRQVVQPLKEIEAGVEAIRADRRANLVLASKDREIRSTVDAINHLLQEIELRQRSLMRSERLAALGTMLSGVAHELNNPLSNISTSCQILQEELGESDVMTIRRYLEQIDQQTERARHIVRTLLDFSRDRGFTRQPVPLRALVEQTVGFVREPVPAKRAVRLEIPEDLVVYADAQRLQQVFVNLICNALEAGGQKARIVIGARQIQGAPLPSGLAWGSGCKRSDVQTEISVSDDGPGIAPEILPRIFDPFFTTKEVGHGMGLGLFVVYEIIEEHGGCIAVESAPGVGTTFRIRLPQKAAQP